MNINLHPTRTFIKSLKGVVAMCLLFCLSTNVYAQPQNDDPCGAIFLSVSNVCTMQVFTNQDATGSAGVADPTCSNYQDDDVWFQVLVPQDGSLIIQTEAGEVDDASMAVYTGDCNNLTQIACDDDSGPGLMPELFLTGLTPNTIIYIRVFTWGGNDVGTFGICAILPPPPPSNDECAGAINIPVNPDLNCGSVVSGTTASATPSAGVPNPSCGLVTGTNDDVWFSFVATTGQHVVSLLNVTGGVTDMVMAVYSGSCGSLTQIACSDPNTLSIGGLTVGDTYYVRVWTYTATTGSSANFNICVGTPPPPPANDECTGAISIPVNPDMNCGSVVAGSTVSALQSSSVPPPTCGAAGINDDVWFSFVATNAQHVVSLLNVSGSTDMAMALYEGTCAGLSQLMCSDPNTMIVGGLTIGNTYYVRVWTWSSTTSTSASFNICVGTPPPPPSNDECGGAISLPVNTGVDCNNVVRGSTFNATQSTGAPTPTCTSIGLNDDVWFSFVAESAQHILSLTNFTGGTSDMAMAVYEGTCGGLVQIACSDPESTMMGNLTPGSTYYVRVWTWSSTATTFAEFDICISTPPPPQPFDDPCGAVLLTVNENGECNFQTFSTINASGTTGVPAPGCAGYQGGDVWFKIVVPCTGSLNINTNTGTITDGGMAIYTGTCDNLTLIECDDDDSPNGFMPMINASNLTPGDTLYVRFWEYSNDNPGTFSICATIPPPPPPAGSCVTAMPFCTSTTPTTVPNITNQPSLGGSGAYGCLFTIPNPTYYYLQIENSGDITIQITQTSNTGGGLDVDFIVWGPFNSLDAACGGITADAIVDCSYSINSVEFADIPNAQAGEFYLFLVTNYSNQPGSITYQQTGGTGTSSCAISCTVEPTNNGPVCSSGTLNLNANTISGATYYWTGPNCFSSTEQNPTNVPMPTTPGVYTYTVVVNTDDGTRCSDTTRVTILGSPQIGPDSTVNICANSSVELADIYSGLEANTNVWSFGGQTIANTNVSTPGVYQLISVNAGGCSDTAEVTLTVSDLALNATFQQAGCAQAGSITAIATGGVQPYVYSINTDPGYNPADGVFDVSTQGQFIVTVEDASGCSATFTTDVTFQPPLSVNAGSDVEIFSAETVQLNATTNQNVNSVLWTPAAGLSSTTILNPTASPEVTTTYTVEVSTIDGCIATDDVTITVVPLCINLRNAFTPNGDGINDLFMVYNSRGCLSKVTLVVFNRYGNKVYESNDYNNNWDGTYKGKSLPDGTYYAVVNYTLLNGKVITRKTDVTILR